MDLILIDTGALLALANPRDQYHQRAIELARRHTASGGRWCGSLLVLAELHGHLLHRRGAELARGIIARLLEDPAFEWFGVTVEVLSQAHSAWLVRFRDQSFSLTDAVSFTLMEREGLGVAFAFDSDFRTAGFQLLS